MGNYLGYRSFQIGSLFAIGYQITAISLAPLLPLSRHARCFPNECAAEAAFQAAPPKLQFSPFSLMRDKQILHSFAAFRRERSFFSFSTAKLRAACRLFA